MLNLGCKKNNDVDTWSVGQKGYVFQNCENIDRFRWHFPQFLEIKAFHYLD